MTDTREAFEAWFGPTFISEWDEDRDCYVDYDCHLAWKGYQAATERATPQWQPIETVPKGAKRYSWMYLAWGPDEDKCMGSGMHADGKFYAAATFYRLGQSRTYGFEEIEVNPTHWMPLPELPARQGGDK